MRNLYQHPPPIRKLDFVIPAQAHNSQQTIRDFQRLYHNLGITYSNFGIAELIKPCIQQSTQAFEHNKDSKSDNNDEDLELIDIDLLCN